MGCWYICNPEEWRRSNWVIYVAFRSLHSQFNNIKYYRTLMQIMILRMCVCTSGDISDWTWFVERSEVRGAFVKFVLLAWKKRDKETKFYWKFICSLHNLLTKSRTSANDAWAAAVPCCRTLHFESSGRGRLERWLLRHPENVSRIVCSSCEERGRSHLVRGRVNMVNEAKFRSLRRLNALPSHVLNGPVHCHGADGRLSWAFLYTSPW